MYNEHLTIEGAAQQIRERGSDDMLWHQWSLDHDSEYATFHRDFRRLRSKGLRNGWLADSGLSLVEGGIEGGEVCPDEFLTEYYQVLNQVDESIYHSLIEPIEDLILCNQYPDAERSFAYFQNIAIILVREVFNNAMMHGVKWCKNGQVQLRFIASPHDWLTVIDQTSGGINLDEFEENRKLKKPHEFLYTVDDVERRGCGLQMAVSPVTPDVRFMNLGQGFRTIIFSTLEMAKERF